MIRLSSLVPGSDCANAAVGEKIPIFGALSLKGREMPMPSAWFCQGLVAFGETTFTMARTSDAALMLSVARTSADASQLTTWRKR